MEQFVVAVATHPEEEGARSLAARLVEEGLAACVQVLPGVVSTYRWEGAVETAHEVRLEIKTSAQRFPALGERFAELHPYDVPELVALPVVGGLPSYLDWVRDSTAE